MPMNIQKSIEQAEKFCQEYCNIEVPTLDDLPSELAAIRELLQNAMVLEHATIPTYLTMLYSIDGDVPWRVLEVVRSVVVEEMLHFTLAGNVLNAIGGEPAINSPNFIPNYPSPLPYHVDGITVSLLPFSKEAVQQGLRIEQPAAVDVAKALRGDVPSMNIGEFYLYIQIRLYKAVRTFGEQAVFCGDRTRQIPPDAYYYDGSGGVLAVYDLRTAIRALQMITDQGEGCDDTIWTGEDSAREAGFREVAHYFRFNELKEERRYQQGDTIESGPTGEHLEVPWHRSVNILINPKLKDYPPGEVRDAVVAFNAQYCSILANLQAAFTGQSHLLIQSVVSMCRLRDSFNAILANPFPGKPGLFSSPTFEYVAVTTPSVSTNQKICPHSSQRQAPDSNAATLQALNDAFATGDLDQALRCMTEDVIWDISGPAGVPYTGVFYGHTGYSRFWTLLNATVSFGSAGTEKTFFHGNEAMAYGGEQGYVKSNNRPYHYDWSVLYRFNDHHKITMMRQYYNPDRIQAALQGNDFPSPTAQ